MIFPRMITGRKIDEWQFAFDSKENTYCEVRRLNPQKGALMDTWVVKETRQKLYAAKGTLPLFITLTQGLLVTG